MSDGDTDPLEIPVKTDAEKALEQLALTSTAITTMGGSAVATAARPR